MELTGAEVRLEQHPHDGYVVVWAWSTAGDPGRRAAMPATTARRLARELGEAAAAADERNGVLLVGHRRTYEEVRSRFLENMAYGDAAVGGILRDVAADAIAELGAVVLEIELLRAGTAEASVEVERVDEPPSTN